jgi:hypothetical protein
VPRPAKEPDRKDDKKKAAPTAPAKDPGSAGVAGIVTIVVISAASTFALMSALKSGSDHVERVEPPAAKIEPATSATVAAAPSAAEAMSAVPMVGAEQALSPTEMDMPPGLALPEDRGLLEFDVGGAAPLYVDGVFVGTGPARVVPLRPGPHEVRVEANGKMIVGLVQIKTGRRTHLALASAR